MSRPAKASGVDPAQWQHHRIFLAAQWRGLTMVSWAVDPALLLPFVPRGTELDFHNGQTFVSLVGFLFLDTALLGYGVPFHRRFEEVNLRLYIRREERGEWRRAVAFIKEIVPRRAIAMVARQLYNEPYVARPMRHLWENYSLDGAPNPSSEVAPRVGYEWQDRGGWTGFSLQGQGQKALPPAGSLEEFIAEHYWGYCAQRDGGTIEYRVEHPRWECWPAATVSVPTTTVASYPPQFSGTLSGPPQKAFLVDGSAVRVFWPRRLALST